MEDRQVIDELLNEYKENRNSIKRAINEISEFKDVLKNIFPKKLDIRNKYILEERVKTTTEFHNVILRYRQELNRMIKDEIELRRKLSDQEKDSDKEINIEQLRRIEKLIKKEDSK